MYLPTEHIDYDRFVWGPQGPRKAEGRVAQVQRLRGLAHDRCIHYSMSEHEPTGIADVGCSVPSIRIDDDAIG